MLAGSTAALLAGAAAATAARAVPLAAPGATGEDAELLRLCGEFHRLHAAASAPFEEADEALMEAALDRRWGTSDQIALIAAMTDAGRRAKAVVASVLLDEWGSLETSSTIIFARAALRDIAGAVEPPLALETEPSPDAELIALCARVVAMEAKRDTIYLAGEDDDEIERQSGLLTPEYDAIRDRLYALGAPTSNAGRHAFARAAIASAQRRHNGSIILDDGGGLASYLAFGLCHSLTEGLA